MGLAGIISAPRLHPTPLWQQAGQPGPASPKSKARSHESQTQGMVEKAHRLFAGVTPGLETLLSLELRRKIPPPRFRPLQPSLSRLVPAVEWKILQGGLEGSVSPEQMWHVAHRSRLVRIESTERCSACRAA
eukprot:3296165-Rhodomonas_salina.1